MKIKKYKSGFTLIELLVVIAIIAILSGVVIVSLNSARDKGQDAAIKQQVAQIRSASVVYEDTYNGFGSSVTASGAGPTVGNCTLANTMFTEPSIAKAINGLRTNAGGSSNVYCGLSGADGNNQYQNWIVYVKLRYATSSTAATNYWCADSNGIANSTTVPLTTTTNSCP